MAGSDAGITGAPGAVSRGLFCIAPDRDERMHQVAMEMFLTLHQNGYAADGADIRSPRRASLLLRSLALRDNFVESGGEHEELARLLSEGQDFAGSDQMNLVQESLRTLVDPATRRGSLGTQLMLPVHSALLWYDVRKRAATWNPQYVLMRGTGITLARFLLSPPASVSDLKGQAAAAVDGIRNALLAPSPFGPIVDQLSDEDTRPMTTEEKAAWNAAEEPALQGLGQRIIRHSSAIMADKSQPREVKLLHLRRIVALDVAWHMLNSAWTAAQTPPESRYLVVCHAPQERADNRARVLSEDSYRAANQTLTRGLLAGLRERMKHYSEAGGEWSRFFLARADGDRRSKTGPYYEDLAQEIADCDPDRVDFDAFANRAFDAPGDGYARPIGALRVMLESCGLVAGEGRWRYMRATPSLLAAMVAARPQSGPQEADEFFHWLHAEWSLVIDEHHDVGSPRLRGEGSVLQRNGEYFERDLVDADLATALSDQTCMVGMRV
jgi:hypothetical protein